MMRTTPRPLQVYLFVALNAVDIALTAAALSLGAAEVNYVFAAFDRPIAMAAVKMVLIGTVVLGLVIFRRIYFINWLNLGLTLVVIWNVVAVWSWLIPLVS